MQQTALMIEACLGYDVGNENSPPKPEQAQP